MKLFEEPKLILLQFSTEDVLTVSGNTYDDEDLGEWN